jgi:uridine kinase
LDGLYVCPHHPDKGFPGEVPELKGPCSCRKPEPGLIDQACHELGIGRKDSWMVGDTTADIEAGRRAEVRTILLRSGHAGIDGKHLVRPDYIAPNLANAVEWILSGHAELTRRLAPIAVEASSGKRLVLIGGLARAGKSYAAQVLKELLHALGRQAHVISLDGWLKPRSERAEGVGVRERFNLDAAVTTIVSAAGSGSRIELTEPLYDRLARNASKHSIEHSIGPDDVLIVEGVSALLIDELLLLPRSMKIYIDIPGEVRNERLTQDYSWRGTPAAQQAATLAARVLDENPIVEQSRGLADFIIGLDPQVKK